MVDWASQNRLYPPGYQSTEIRTSRTSIDSSLPYSVSPNKKHSCRIETRRSKKIKKNEVLLETLHHGLDHAFQFFSDISTDDADDRNPKLLATYAANINWPRSVCCITGDDSSIILCEQDRCRLLLFTPQLMLRSTCGGKKGNDQYEFDSPSNVASLLDPPSSLSSPYILVADTNNRRVQCFSIGYQDRFIYKHTIPTKQKPYFIATSNEHFAVSCEKCVIETFLSKEKRHVANIDLNKTSFIKRSIQIALPICMDTESSFLFIGNTISSVSTIHQLTISGEYLRTIEFVHFPFLRVTSMVFDNYDQQIIVADSFNSLIYSLDPDLDDDNMEILLKRSDKINCPQDLSISSEGHLMIVECSVNTEHALKMFRHHLCQCHSRRKALSVKTSETTSVRSMIFSYQ